MNDTNNKMEENEGIENSITIKISRNTKEIFHSIIIVILAIILLQNTQKVEFTFLFWQIFISKLILLTIFFLLGYLFIRLNVFSFISKNKKK